jgi:hypothetical protein
MNKTALFFLFIAAALLNQPAGSQDVYPMSSWENLFQLTKLDGTPQQNVTSISERLRYTIVLNYGQYWHVDFTNSVGFYSGLAVRNVGFIYDTDIPTKTIRRSYNLGIPLALKLGGFDKHFYVFGGGEYELMFHYKAKRWNSNERDGAKIKDREWFSDKTRRFIPGWFVGIQFPGGFKIKYKNYIGDFLNHDYVGNDLGQQNVSFADYKKIDLHYISLCWQFRTDVWKKYIPAEKTAYRF